MTDSINMCQSIDMWSEINSVNIRAIYISKYI